MNLKYLYEIQAGLMAHIEKNHPTPPGENRLDKKVLATLVELGEGCNDSRCFKFWSLDQKPKETLLEETVDFLHFLLELGIEFGYRVDTAEFTAGKENLVQQYLELYKNVLEFYETKDFVEYEDLFETFLGLCEMLGFPWEEVEKAYLAKNSENHNRQLNSY